MPKILLVDDDPDFLFLCRRILEAEGYQVMEARSGSQALEMMRKTPPDLVLLDVMMSTTLEGVDVSKMLKADPALKHIPLIMISSITTSEYASEYPEERVPIDAWISKPIQPEFLLKTVRRFLK